MTDTLPWGISEEIDSTKYRLPGETFREKCNRIASALADRPTVFHNFRDLLLTQKFLPGGRIQATAGTSRATTMFNCFVSGTISDSFVDGEGSIMQRATEAAQTMRMGGGIGYDFSTLRPRGDRIAKLDSKASGPVSFMGIFDAICKTVASSGHRRGAQMGVLRVDHPDIEEFIHAKQNTTSLTGFNVSVGVTDEFMKAVEWDRYFDLKFDGRVHKTIKARSLWEQMMRSTWYWGEPGVIFLDRLNAENNLYYCETLAATNPCFTGDTKVWTADGHKTFTELAATGEPVQVLTQTEDGRLVYRTMTNPRMTRRNQRLVRITFDNGTTVRCTPDHRIFLKDGTVVEAASLKRGTRIASVYRWRANQKGYLRVSNGDHAPLEHRVPFEEIPPGYCVHHIDGVKTNNSPSNLELISIREHNSMHIMGDKNPSRRFPGRASRDVKGVKNPRYRHDVSDDLIKEMRDAGLSNKAIARQLGVSSYTVSKRLGWERPNNHRVVSVEYLDETEDVYCGTVEATGRFFVALGDNDGILVSNCAEQPLPPFGACLLGSFNLTQYAKPGNFNMGALTYDVWTVVRCLDWVVDSSIYPLPEQREEALSKRRMGIGITGLANAAAISFGYPYGSDAFCDFAGKIMETIRNQAYLASSTLATERGSFPLFDKEAYLDGAFASRLPGPVRSAIAEFGLRNSHLISIAPTGTISLTAGNVSSGIEPVWQLEYQRVIGEFDGQRVETVKDYAWGEFGKQNGLATEISPQEHLKVMAAVQPYVDSAVSKTVNVPHDLDWEAFKDVYMSAYKMGLKSCATFTHGGQREGILRECKSGECSL